MTYQVILQRPAEKELDALESSVHKRIVTRLLALEENPRPAGVKKLQGQESYRLRVGDYRVLYTINDKSRKIFIMAVGHRREVYR
ncbi:MAG: type II toxin-antitoxin system RelE family toxin [Chloroflexota bacterium]